MLRRSLRRALLCGAAATAVVSWASVPAGAQVVSVVGGGVVQLTITLASPGLAPVLALTCAPDSFTVSGNTQVASIDVADQQDYIGPLAVTGSGGAPCADLERDFFGFITLSVNGSNQTGTVSCATLSGDYVRVGAAVTVQVAGGCVVNGFRVVITLIATGIFQPTQGDGIVTPVLQGQYTGPFAVFG
jgi:hypothetical protein